MEVTYMYKDGDLVLIKYKRGAKLAQIEAINERKNTLPGELESEIGGNRENEYEAGCSSGRQRAITALEALL